MDLTITSSTAIRVVTAANEVAIGGFWMEHARGELKIRKNHEVLRFLSPCWEKRYLNKVFYTGDTIFEAFVQELLNMPINLLLAVYLVYLRYLFNMEELTAFRRLMRYGESLSVRKAHPIVVTYWYKCAAGLKTLLAEYLLMQNWYLTGEERKPKTREEVREANGGIPLLTDLCLAMRSDPVGMIRGLGEVVTCVCGPAVTYAFPDLLVVAYRHSVVHVSPISILDGTALNW